MANIIIYYLLFSRYRDSNVYRLLVMLALTVAYFLAEIIVGLLTGSLALVSDASHMASDGLSLIIGLVALLVQIIMTII